MKARCRPWSQTTTGETVLAVRNFLFLTCSTRTRTLRLPQTIPHTITTSHTNRNPSLIIPPFLPPHSFSNNYHYDHRIPPFVTTNQPQSLQQRTQRPIPKRIHPYPTGTHDPGHGDLGHLGHTGQGPFGTTVNHAPSLFIYKRIPGT